MRQDNATSSEQPLKQPWAWPEFDSQASAGIRQILVPIDFSPCSERALAQAVALARDWSARITLLYVVDLALHTPPTAPVDSEKLKAELWKDGCDQLGQTVLQLVGQGVEVQTLIREGLPCEQIVEAAHDDDLIVIGQRKPKPFWRLFSRHTVKGVLDAAPCPVLVVREENQKEQTTR